MRIGNFAATQLQLDIYGELVDSIYIYNKYGSPISPDAWEDVSRLVDRLCDHWDQADEGVWETGGGSKHLTTSRLMCWVALERALRIAPYRGLPADERLCAECDRIYRHIFAQCWSEPRQAFVQRAEGDVVDASVLLIRWSGSFRRPTRAGSTLDAIGDELCSDAFVYRYNVEAAPDGLRRRGGHVRVPGGARSRRPRGRSGPRVREDAHLRQPPLAVRRADRADRRTARQLPAGLHTSSADQRRREPSTAS